MRALISCTRCSQVAGHIQKVGRRSLKASSLCELSFVQLSACIHTVNFLLRDTMNYTDENHLATQQVIGHT